MNRQYLVNQSNDTDIDSLSVRLLYANDTLANIYKQQNKHMEKAHHLGKTYGMTLALLPMGAYCKAW